MAWGVFVFSRDGRQRLGGVLRALLILQLVVSLCMVIFCYNTSLRVMLLLKHIHKVRVYLLHGLIILQAYSMKLHYTAGLRLITLLLKYPYWLRITKVTKIWLMTGILVTFNGLLVYAACRRNLKALMKELSSSLRMGISLYLSETSWKILMDTMQVELSCCGAEKPSDWHEIPWINIDFLNESSEVVIKLAGADGKLLPPVSPYSCCTPRVLAPCYHDPLQQYTWREVWLEGSPLPPASLHTRGCVEAIRAPLTKALLALHFFNILVFLFQYKGILENRHNMLTPNNWEKIIILILSQLLRTSAQDAVMNGEWDGKGRGCLVGTHTRGDVAKQASSTSLECGDPRVYSSCAVSLRRRRRRKKTRVKSSYPCLS